MGDEDCGRLRLVFLKGIVDRTQSIPMSLQRDPIPASSANGSRVEPGTHPRLLQGDRGAGIELTSAPGRDAADVCQILRTGKNRYKSPNTGMGRGGGPDYVHSGFCGIFCSG